MNTRIFKFICSFALIVPLTACSGQDDSGDSDSLNKTLLNLSETLNKRLPDMADEDTVLEATSGSNMQFTFYYTLLNYTATEIDIDTFIRQMKPALIQNACTSETLAPLTGKGVSIRYVYADKDRKEFSRVTVTPAECAD